ncbi:hypothetical protein ACJIZ3_008836 [Penstemon smallii]|uniref:Uncharacterized protein n=1 Tax=Penstemon smallii TaxID=265156 RepID=A0ABD3TC76_9LAMI
MQRLLPSGFSLLPKNVWNPLTELSLFFRDLCSTELRTEKWHELEKNIPLILCKLEIIFSFSYNDLHDKYCWNQENERAIRRIYKMKAGKELYDRPNWIGVGYWDLMVHRWKTDPKFIPSSQKNKQNRASDCDGMGFPLYAGGSKSQLCHSDDIVTKPSRADVFMITHSKVVDGQREWIDERSEFTHVSYFILAFFLICCDI